jgi:hypothetical protein
MQVCPVTTQLYYLTNQQQVSANVNSHHQADPKNTAAILVGDIAAVLLVGDIAAVLFLSFYILGIDLITATKSNRNM